MEQVAAVAIPQRPMQMGAVAGEPGDRLGIEAHRAAVLLSQAGGHHLEEGMAIGGGEGFGVGPVEFELAVGVFMVGLIGGPAQLLHRADQLTDQRIAAHQGQLVVAGFGLMIQPIGHAALEWIEQEELRLDAAAELKSQSRSSL